jgi:hypothetical protein
MEVTLPEVRLVFLTRVFTTQKTQTWAAPMQSAPLQAQGWAVEVFLESLERIATLMAKAMS